MRLAGESLLQTTGLVCRAFLGRIPDRVRRKSGPKKTKLTQARGANRHVVSPAHRELRDIVRVVGLNEAVVLRRKQHRPQRQASDARS